MTDFATRLTDVLKSLVFTSVFCLIIAFATHAIWPSPFWSIFLSVSATDIAQY